MKSAFAVLLLLTASQVFAARQVVHRGSVKTIAQFGSADAASNASRQECRDFPIGGGYRDVKVVEIRENWEVVGYRCWIVQERSR